MKAKTPQQRLREIAATIEACGHAGIPVTPTRLQMTGEEMRRIYAIAKGSKPRKRRKP